MTHRPARTLVRHLWPGFLTEERGATSTEYGVLMSFIVVATIAIITLFGLALQGWFDELTVHLKLLLGIP
ncbi:Flp family type IVb pilin [Pseudarthrobacter sp. GA104]|nr:Flp family type IVb pilin [Pseudarthrobacter sp. GA104]